MGRCPAGCRWRLVCGKGARLALCAIWHSGGAASLAAKSGVRGWGWASAGPCVPVHGRLGSGSPFLRNLQAVPGFLVDMDVFRRASGQGLNMTKVELLLVGVPRAGRCGSPAAHGDVRGPNVLVRTTEGGGSTPEVRIIDFDWWVRARVGEVDGMRVRYACL